jgi:hypothetical protein
LHELTRREKETLALNSLTSGKDIIATSPWVSELGSYPYRIVLRDTEADFIVHTQSVDTGALCVSLFWGDYFHKFHTSGSDLDAVFAKAWAKFVERANRSLDVILECGRGHVA